MICPISHWRERHTTAQLQRFAKRRRIYAAFVLDRLEDDGYLFCQSVKLIAKLREDAETFLGRAGRVTTQTNQGQKGKGRRAKQKQIKRRRKALRLSQQTWSEDEE